MKKIGTIFSIIALIAAAVVLPLVVTSCGGGGGSSTPAPAATAQHGNGKVAAAVTLTGRAAGRTAAQLTGTLTVEITISGDYSEDGEPFEDIVEVVDIDLEQGYAQISILDVPTGYNHLLVAVADWGSTQETVMVIIPEVIAGETASVIADEKSTAVALAAIYYAEQQGVSLSELEAETIEMLDAAITALHEAGTPYSDITPAAVQNFIEQAGEPVSMGIEPATANVVVENTLQFDATVYDANGIAVAVDSIGWSFDTETVGAVDDAGLFTAGAVGTGVLTATYNETLSATAAITVLQGCSIDTDCNDGVDLTVDTCTAEGTCSNTTVECATDADCDDGSTLTLDTCTNGGTLSAACDNTAIACTTSADCGGMAPVCVDGGTVDALCVECSIDLDCDDEDSGTIDTCVNGSTAGSYCENAPVACFDNADCDDGNSSNIDTCYNAGLATATCGHSSNISENSTISVDTTWGLTNSPYILAGQIMVDTGVTLTIDPGVEVYLDCPSAGTDMFGDAGYNGIMVNGSISAVGTAANPISFQCNPAGQARMAATGVGNAAISWGGIYFTSSSTAGTLQYVTMEAPNYALVFDYTNGDITLDNISMSNIFGTATSYHIYAKTHDGWQEVGVEHYGLDYDTRRVNVSRYLPDVDGEYKLRIRQTGNHAAQIDEVRMRADRETLAPVSMTDVATGEDAMFKMLGKDNDVIDAHERTFEVEFAAPKTGAAPEHVKLLLTAREEGQQVLSGGKPFYYPQSVFRKAADISDYYGYIMETRSQAFVVDGLETRADNLGEAAFVEHTQPQSGHPEGDVYGYISNDDKYLYAALDFTPDNTMDGAADYATLHVKVGDAVKSFRVSVPEQRWGAVGFVYTDRVNYQHKYYEFKIPLSEIGGPEPGQAVQYMFEAYGTASTFEAAINILYPVSGNVSISNVDMTFQPDAYIKGMRLHDVTSGSVSISNLTMAGASGSSYYYPVYIQNVPGLSIDGLSISDAYDNTGLSINSTNNATLQNISIDNSRQGVALNNSTNVSITNLSVAGSSMYPGLDVFECTDVSCINCQVTGSSASNLYALNTTNMSVTQGSFLGSTSGHGVYLYYTSATMSGIDASFNYDSGINIYNGSQAVSISNSRIAGNCSLGANNDSAGTVDISSSNIEDNGNPGVVGANNMDDVYLAGNNGAGAGVADTSTTTPHSDSSPAQYYSVNVVTSPRSTPVSGLPDNTDPETATCGGE